MTWLRPRRRAGEFAFVTAPAALELADLDIAASVREREGLTLVVPVEQAAARGLVPTLVVAWIELELPTGLDAVGITARFSAGLAEAGIACNVLAGVYHDHVLVPTGRADEAVTILAGLTPR